MKKLAMVVVLCGGLVACKSGGIGAANSALEEVRAYCADTTLRASLQAKVCTGAADSKQMKMCGVVMRICDTIQGK